jgi:hypothetical protein
VSQASDGTGGGPRWASLYASSCPTACGRTAPNGAAEVVAAKDIGVSDPRDASASH